MENILISGFWDLINKAFVLTITILSIANLSLICKYWSILKKTKYKLTSIALFCFNFIYVPLMPFSADKLGDIVNNCYYIILSISEILFYYTITVSTGLSNRQNKWVLTISIIAIFMIIVNTFKNDEGSNDEHIFMIISLLYTNSSLQYFKKLSENPETFLNVKKSDIFLQLALFLCNSLPMTASICEIGIKAIVPNFNSRWISDPSSSVGMFNILQYFSLIGYSLLLFYTIKALRWIKQTYTLM